MLIKPTFPVPLTQLGSHQLRMDIDPTLPIPAFPEKGPYLGTLLQRVKPAFFIPTMCIKEIYRVSYQILPTLSTASHLPTAPNKTLWNGENWENPIRGKIDFKAAGYTSIYAKPWNNLLKNSENFSSWSGFESRTPLEALLQWLAHWATNHS